MTFRPSLAVTYRPKDLDQVIGQRDVVADLGRGILSRAYLFVGPSGVGKTSLARIIANMAAGGAAPANIVEVDAASYSGVNDIRRVIDRTRHKALGASPVKTVIIDECDRLSDAAWSSLLKPIEEPPAHVIWCLCTTDGDKIPHTIQTRCVTYKLGPVGRAEIMGLLSRVAEAENIQISPDELAGIADMCGGSPRQALTYLEHYRRA